MSDCDVRPLVFTHNFLASKKALAFLCQRKKKL
jgi:hypothetical protein